MAIKGVDTKCYILALFVRDDGERFLLGSGHYEFKDTQMHFAANAIQNDIVEVQGNDGFLLAGQVRRPGTQSFDGYVGDGTMSKEETESYRRQFFSFFRKNYFYKVIYVFSDGTAIQRKSGFLVDDPTVEELYQMYPEYHVALNFEDVNYYSYSENEQGEEIYAEEAQIDLSSMLATGGLVWDEYGAVNQGYAWGGETAVSGTEFTVQNDLSLPAPITETRLNGDTYQQTYSGKNLIGVPDGIYSSRGLTFTRNNNTIVCSGTKGAGNNWFVMTGDWVTLDNPLPAGTYTFSISEPTTKRIEFSVRFSDSTATTYIVKIGDTTRTFTTEKEIAQYRLVASPFNVDESADGVVYKDIQLEASSTATDYEPYVGGIPAPNPDYPQDVQVVTGEQTVTVSDGTNSQSYTVDLGATELCKLGDYQDYIYKSGSDWYVHKEIGKQTFTGQENWQYSGTSSGPFRIAIPNSKYHTSNDVAPLVYCDYYTPVAWSLIASYNYAVTAFNNNVLPFRNTDITSLDAWKAWLGSHNMTVYYPFATSSDTKITDATLISQLNRVGSMKLFVGENNLSVLPDTNLPASLSFKYYTTVEATGSGAIWEEGGSGGATVVEVDSITNTYPIWRVKGPAVDPQLSVINTNTTIRYTGTVTSTQTLEIDMFNKTAKLNGVSVIGNVSGDWVSLAPGTNRVIYTAENADAQPSTIEWQEVVG